MNHALNFAALKHAGQTRKFVAEPYIHHIVRVAGYSSLYVTDAHDTLYMPVAYLHDTIEDCNVTYEEIEENFGEDIAEGVLHLTNLFTKENYPYLKRIERKFKEIDRLSECPKYIKQIKLCDRLDNISFVNKAPEKWKCRYFTETRYMIEKIGEASIELSFLILERINNK